MSRPFHPNELTGADAVQPTTAELAESLAMARELESRLAAADVHPSSAFADRVMAAVVAQPRPQPALAAAVAFRRGRMGEMLAALADNWRVTFSGHHPLAVRAQAMAFVLIAILAVGSLGGVAAIGAVRLLGPAPSQPVPASQQAPVSRPTPSPDRGPTTSDPTKTPEPTDTAEPTETAEPTGTKDPQKTPGATEAPEPSGTAEPNEADEPGPTDNGDGSHGGSGGGGEATAAEAAEATAAVTAATTDLVERRATADPRPGWALPSSR